MRMEMARLSGRMLSCNTIVIVNTLVLTRAALQLTTLVLRLQNVPHCKGSWQCLCHAPNTGLSYRVTRLHLDL